MNKFAKLLVVSGMVAAMAFVAGCGDEKKPEPAKKPATTTAQKPAPKAKVKPVPKSPLYRYAVHLDDESAVMPMTPEIIAEFEKQAKKFQLPPADKKAGIEGIWVFGSNMSKGAQINWYRWSAKMDKHHATKWEENGKKVDEQHYVHIDITTTAKDNKITAVKVIKYDVTPQTTAKGKTTVLVDEKRK